MTIKLKISCNTCGYDSVVYNALDVDCFKYMGWRFSKEDGNIHTCKSCHEKSIKHSLPVLDVRRSIREQALLLISENNRDVLDDNCKFIRKTKNINQKGDLDNEKKTYD